LATIGIKPLRPETGYGYIEISKDANGSDGMIHPVMKFHEKPDRAKAEEYLKEGNYFWNSGMFFWRLDTFIDSMMKCLPLVGNHIDEMGDRFRGKSHIPLPEHLHTIEDIFEAFPNISIDYGLMEKADNVVVAKASFKWDDIGSWDSVARIRESDSHGNVIGGKVVLTDSKDSIIINESEGKIITSVLGVEGLVVVVTDDAILICPKDRVQEIRKSVDKIRNEYGDKWL
jgi:mannose-1-phosphate guanylyltransferase